MNFSRASSGESLRDNRRMAATLAEGTARKPVFVNAEALTRRQSNSGNMKLPGSPF
jgi:hypothetical protein